MELHIPNKQFINKILVQHDNNGGNRLNRAIGKLFLSMNELSNINEIMIRVASLNEIYSTAINYIDPVAEKILAENPENFDSFTEDDFICFVDKIAPIKWKSKTTNKVNKRFNLSFASKYVHFQSKQLMPIYDSYIWILLNGYIGQKNNSKIVFSTPKTYKEFYNKFVKFKKEFKLYEYTNYDIDKFLWTYGKGLVEEIIERESVDMNKAKRILKNRLKE